MPESFQQRSLMNEEQLKKWVLRKVGALRLRIELHPADLDDLIEDTKEWYTAHKGQVRELRIALSANVTEYTLPGDADTVLDVIPSDRAQEWTDVYYPQAFRDEAVPYDIFAAGANSGGLYSNHYQANQYMKQASMVLGSDFNWSMTVSSDGARVLNIYPYGSRVAECIVRYKSTNLVIEQLDYFDYQLIKRHVLASAKVQLGRYRSKYGSVPGAQGEKQLDGASILEEGRAELEKLDEDIRTANMPLPFLVG